MLQQKQGSHILRITCFRGSHLSSSAERELRFCTGQHCHLIILTHDNFVPSNVILKLYNTEKKFLIINFF